MQLQRLSFNLKEETHRQLEELVAKTRINKSELMKLMIEKNYQDAYKLDISARKKNEYTKYTNLLVTQDMYIKLQIIIDNSKDTTARIGTLARAIIEYSLKKNNFFPF